MTIQTQDGILINYDYVKRIEFGEATPVGSQNQPGRPAMYIIDSNNAEIICGVWDSQEELDEVQRKIIKYFSQSHNFLKLPEPGFLKNEIEIPERTSAPVEHKSDTYHRPSRLLQHD